MARTMWHGLELVHAGVYFAPEAKDEYAAIGLKGWWMGYFASRAAPMGPVPAEVVIATFYNFHPDRVHRAIPDAWSFAAPEPVLEARLRVADAVMRRAVVAEDERLEEAAELAGQCARAALIGGRALFGGHASLPWPTGPRLRLWHAATLLREHRGDGHIAMLVTENIDGFEAHALAAAAGTVQPALQRDARGISESEWDQTVARLADRGLLTSGGSFTDAGRELKERIEARTDALASQPYEAVGQETCARLADLLGSIMDNSGVPKHNPIGLVGPGR